MKVQLIHGPLAYHIPAAGHDIKLFDWKLYLGHDITLWFRPLPVMAAPPLNGQSA